MNQTQIKYAKERAAAILRARTEALREKHTVPAVRLSDTEKLEALRAGRFTTDFNSGGWWYQRITFTDARDAKFDRAAFELDEAALTASFRKLTDELVLGDNEEALELLREFEGASEASPEKKPRPTRRKPPEKDK